MTATASATVTAAASPAVRRRRWLTAGGVLITALYLLPVYWMLATSLKESSDIFATPPQLFPSPISLTSYTETVVNHAGIGRGLLNSTVIGIGTTLVTLAVAVPAAYALARLRVRFVALLMLLFLVVQMVPAVNLASSYTGISSCRRSAGRKTVRRSFSMSSGLAGSEAVEARSGRGWRPTTVTL